MTTTWVGRFACWLGFHLPMQSGFTLGSHQGSWGRCLRCGESWTLDGLEKR